MATTLGSKGVAILFFTIVIALFAYFIYFLVTGGTDPAYDWHKRSPKAPVSQTLAAAPAKSLTLIRNKVQTVGRLRILYLGVADKHLRFDVNLLDLDPNFAYRYTIPLDQAKQRFRIADQYFKATTISNGKIRLTQKSLQ